MKSDNLKIAYIGGGSRAWARKLMNDLALEKEFLGEVRLFDIDYEAAKDNELLGNIISTNISAVNKWKYKAVRTIEAALSNADFVIISILPGSFEEMESDVHLPEKYGIFQPVGDTVGIGGYLRAMRTIPMYRGFAAKIREICPDAWVINYTNPMTLCVRTLYEEFPGIKAFGCCHEVFSTQEMFICALKDLRGIENVKRSDIKCDLSGINHFTWLASAKYKDINLFEVFEELSEKYGKKGFITYDNEKDKDMMQCGHNIKFEMYKAYGVIPAAGDRHLAEFLPAKWYLSSKQYANSKKFQLTPVSWRKKDQAEKIALTKQLISGKQSVMIEPSGEEGVMQIKALLGIKDIVTNINIPNCGQIKDYPLGAVVETNAKISKNKIEPLKAGKLPAAVDSMILRHVYNQGAFIKAAFLRSIDKAKLVIYNDPQCASLTRESAEEMLNQMIQNTYSYLKDYWNF